MANTPCRKPSGGTVFVGGHLPTICVEITQMHLKWVVDYDKARYNKLK